jgi:hypothetical protein
MIEFVLRRPNSHEFGFIAVFGLLGLRLLLRTIGIGAAVVVKSHLLEFFAL